jgi:hypothetical protein
MFQPPSASKPAGVLSRSESESGNSAERAVEQMRAATDRLREQAWLLAPLNSAVSEPSEAEAEAEADTA